MISLDVKPESSSPLSNVFNATDKKPTQSFSELLKGVKLKGTNKEIKNGVVVLSLDKNVKKTINSEVPKSSNKVDTLLSLLNNNKKIKTLKKEPKEHLLLNPELTKSFTPKDLKIVINSAKEYLKRKIYKSPEYIKSQAKELPKTLKGLATLAKNFGIDVHKITLKDVQIKTAVAVNKEAHVLQKIPFEKKIKADVKHSISLFKAQTQKEHTTEQMVQTKMVAQEHKTPKKKADNTLKLLLRGEKAVKSDTRLTADFSVATAQVIAPSTTKEVHKGLESLLKANHKSSQSDIPDSKLDGLVVPKVDSFKVKLGEAKQMVKYISQDVKTAIEDYKSPFTRVKLQLNPQKLGEVDLTIVQRGKNLHINLSSNNTAINTLAMNANDLKAQLNNNGINNATLNFSNGSQGEQNSNAQQQHQHDKQNADHEYNYFENQETNEEILNSLEIVVSRYA